MHAGDSPLILDELEVCHGNVRADLAVLNGVFAGYEIKSERDTLERLPAQATAYGKVFDVACLVAAPSHIPRAQSLIPEWWGIMRVEAVAGTIRISEERAGTDNPALDPYVLGMLLWRNEALRLLEQIGFDQGVRTKPTACMVSRLCERLPASDVAVLVRQTIKSRGDWRSAARQKRRDGLCRPSPTSSRFRTPSCRRNPECTGPQG